MTATSAGAAISDQVQKIDGKSEFMPRHAGHVVDVSHDSAGFNTTCHAVCFNTQQARAIQDVAAIRPCSP